MPSLYTVTELKWRNMSLDQNTRSFITANMPVYTYNMKGDWIADYPYIQDNCYYGGYVEDTVDSQALLSTCTGLWGHVQIGNLRYEVEPIENSPTFQHLIYRTTPEHLEPCRGIVEDGVELANEAGELRMVDRDDPISSARGLDDPEYYTTTRYLEYYAVVDKSTFILNHRNESRLLLIMLRMMSDVHSIYLPLGFRIYLVGLELWTERNYITIDTENLSMTLVAFYHYASYELQHRVHFDHSSIITAKGVPAGLAWGDRFCLYTHVSVSAVRTYRNPKVDAETIAHELGHSLGFAHDDTPLNKARGCDCNCTKPGSCIMAAGGNPTCSRLSNCSRQVYYDTIRKPGKECFLDIPSNVFRRKICGNGIIDDKEECDCGHDEGLQSCLTTTVGGYSKPLLHFETPQKRQGERAHPQTERKTASEDVAASEKGDKIAVGAAHGTLMLDSELEGAGILNLFIQPGMKFSGASEQFLKQWMQRPENPYSFADHPHSKDLSECRRNGCCQKDCKFLPDIDCLYGLCCEKCMYLGEGRACREAASECDLPEYCNGTSANCPPDVHKQDGTPCSNSNHCFMGNCLDLHKHCTALFGQGAKQAPLSCFKEVNMRGDRTGNCGEDGLKYKKCDEEDVLCGRLQCIHIKKIPKMLTRQAVVQTPVEDTLCWGVEFHLGRDIYDLGAVRDGTTCGIDKICRNRSCVDRDILNYDCDFSKCNNRGVCNSKRNCHCSYGWAPPFCSGRGFGGSIDSGPPPSYMSKYPLLPAHLGSYLQGALLVPVSGESTHGQLVTKGHSCLCFGY
ncbi:disintegrin and metalloproteinase domain-containing protein 20-like [Rhineura floridana]|uniref:disintegrin and metalloproteinase domain-containing protein 20-like n=1 Tax=Rhineura floridana TaxID=261503 RepID=UPI002AC7EA0B|nr:disintegrin and metalloproteinase domain-containing protein 20-like [Rhineura floridana]